LPCRHRSPRAQILFEAVVHRCSGQFGWRGLGNSLRRPRQYGFRQRLRCRPKSLFGFSHIIPYLRPALGRLHLIAPTIKALACPAWASRLSEKRLQWCVCPRNQQHVRSSSFLHNHDHPYWSTALLLSIRLLNPSPRPASPDRQLQPGWRALHLEWLAGTLVVAPKFTNFQPLWI
jgi:hypothetical protein